MKKTALIVFKFLVAAVLLWYIFTYKINAADLWNEMRNAEPGWLLLAFLVNGSILLPAVWRWHLLLRAQGIEAGFYPTFWTTCAGNFFNSFLLGLTGGDIARIYYATQLAPSKKVGAGVSVAVDRIVGLLGLLVLAGLVLLFFGGRFWEHEQTRRAVLGILAALGLAGLGVVVYLNQRTLSGWTRWNQWRHRLPLQKAINHLRQINEAYHNNQGALLKAIVISVFVHILSVFTVYLIGRSLQIGAPLIAFYLALPIINAVTAIPISPGGVGLRESMFILMFNIVGVHDNDKVMAMSFLYFGVIVLTSVVAGAVYMLGRPASMHTEKISDIIAKES
jgi:uncharacterized protein (TIRG00374 family)